MIRVENNLFFLEGSCYSYVLRINEANMAEHLHFGAKITTRDAQAMDDQETLVLTLKHPMGLLLNLCYTVFSTALVRRAALVNPTEKVVTIRKLMSFCVDLPGQFEMISFHGH